MPYSIFISGTQYTGANIVEAGSLSITNSVGRHGEASFKLHTSADIHFKQYQPVEIYDHFGNLAFSGYINQPKETRPGYQWSLNHDIQCIDQTWLAQKRRVVASYTNKTAGFIVQDLVNNILAAEGVTVGMIYDGVTPSTTLYPSPTLYPGGNVGLIPSVIFAYCKVSEALDALVKAVSASGVPYYWSIDQNKQLYFVPYTAIVNTTLVDGSQIDRAGGETSVTRANPSYRNGQYITGGVNETTPPPATRKGDGNTTSWAMDYDLAHEPTISVNGTAKTVGIRGVDTGKDFYWSKGDPNISQDESATKLTSSDTLSVTYIGQYPNAVYVQDGAAISAQAAIDGTSGIIEDVQEDGTITSADDGLDEASRLLTRYTPDGLTLSYPTRQYGFDAGQLITVDMSWHALNMAQMLITQVTASDGIDGLNIWWTVTAIQGPYDTTWTDFFSKLLATQQPVDAINVGSTQSSALLVSLSATRTPTATLTATPLTSLLPSPTRYPGTTVYPA